MGQFRHGHRLSISRGNSVDGRNPNANSRSAFGRKDMIEKKSKVDVYQLDQWLYMDRERTSEINFDHLSEESIDTAGDKMYHIVLNTINSTLKTKLRPIHKHLLDELKSIITTIYNHCEVKKEGAWTPWRQRMKTKIEDLVCIMIKLSDCQFIALLAFFLHSAPNPSPKSMITYISILNLSESCVTDLRLKVFII